MPLKARFKFLDVSYTNEEGEKVLDYLRAHVRQAREERGVSQRGLSEMVLRSKNFILRIENGETVPSVLEMIDIARNLQKPMKWFILPRYRDRDDPKQEIWKQEVIEKLEGMNEEVRKATIETIDNFSNIKVK